MPDLNETHARMLEHYAEGNMPWDDELPPPEVLATVQQLGAGRALDLGCGYGRAARYFARQGWTVNAVDFVTQAIETARERSADFPEISYTQGSVTQLDFLQPPYDFALDVGCGHALNDADLALYRDELGRLLRAGGTFLCFGRIQTTDDQSGFAEDVFLRLFKEQFTLTKAEYGETTFPGSAWRSGWFWWQKS